MIAFDVFYRSDQFLDLDLDPNTRQGAFTIVNGRIGVSTLDDKLSVGVAVSNMTDTNAFEYVIDSTDWCRQFKFLRSVHRWTRKRLACFKPV